MWMETLYWLFSQLNLNMDEKVNVDWNPQVYVVQPPVHSSKLCLVLDVLTIPIWKNSYPNVWSKVVQIHLLIQTPQ